MSLLDFASSWGLFARSYSLTLIAAPLLTLLGVYAVARRQLFIAAAISQSAVFGFASFALIFGAYSAGLGGSLGQDALVIACAVIAALLAMLGTEDAQGGRLSKDEVIASVFIMAGVGSTLILSRAPAGMELTRQLQASSVVGARWLDVAVFALALTALAAVILWHRKSIVLFLTDPVMASAIGLRVGAWNLGATLACGVIIGLSVRSTGMMFTFGCLALPVLIGKQLCAEVRTLLLVSPCVAALSALIGLWAAYAWDLPPGQSVVGLQGVLLATAAGLRTLWHAPPR